MENPKTAYIALGSNKGDKFKNLQDAVDLIFKRIGNIISIAKVYKSEAIGFEGDEFLNTCLCLETYLKPEEVLSNLLAIETKMGRTRTQSEGYESRVIDLDVIFYEEENINTETLKVPHPEFANRRFVLQPLNDLNTKLKSIHSQYNIEKLLEVCKDKTPLEAIKIWLKNPCKNYDFTALNYIAIEGNIGAGKTSLAKKMAHDFNAKSILERFADNPFLPKFYEDQSRYAFTLEMSFLADRYQQISDDLAQLDLFKDFIVSDYDVFKSLIFSKITLLPDEFKLYRKLFYLMYKDIKKPSLYVYLNQSTEQLQKNIKKRGRDYEQHIESDYLNKINAGYLEFLKTQTDIEVKIIDVTDRDFVNNRADYLWILDEICG